MERLETSVHFDPKSMAETANLSVFYTNNLFADLFNFLKT